MLSALSRHLGVVSIATPLLMACGSGGQGATSAAAVKSGPSANTPVARGEWVFHTAGCALCHGDAGKGGVNNANSETGGKINGLLLIKEGYDAKQLEERIREGVFEVGKGDPKGRVPPLRMPAYGAWLSKQDVSDLVAYLFSLYPKKGGGEADDWDDDGDKAPAGDTTKPKEPPPNDDDDDEGDEPDTSRGPDTPATPRSVKDHTRASAR